jgi:hypothetical protein
VIEFDFGIVGVPAKRLPQRFGYKYKLSPNNRKKYQTKPIWAWVIVNETKKVEKNENNWLDKILKWGEAKGR